MHNNQYSGRLPVETNVHQCWPPITINIICNIMTEKKQRKERRKNGIIMKNKPKCKTYSFEFSDDVVTLCACVVCVCVCVNWQAYKTEVHRVETHQTTEVQR